MAAREIRDKVAKIAGHLVEVSEEDLDWEPGQFSVTGAPDKLVSIQGRLRQHDQSEDRAGTVPWRRRRLPRCCGRSFGRRDLQGPCRECQRKGQGRWQLRKGQRWRRIARTRDRYYLKGIPY